MDYTDQSTPEERERLDAETSACRVSCEELAQLFEAAQVDVSLLEEESQALEDAVAERIGLLRDRAQALRSRIASQSDVVESRARGVAERGAAAAAAYAAASVGLHQRAAEVGQRVQHLREANGEQLHSGLAASDAATHEFDALLSGVEVAVKDCGKVVDEELRAHADHLLAAATASKEGLAAQARDAFHVVVVGGVEEHMRLASDSLLRKKEALQQLILQLKTVLGEIGASFGGVQAAELLSLGGALGDTERSVSAAMGTIESAVRELTGTATQVSDALETTQSGLRIVTGCLERTKRILEEIETL